VIDDQQIEFERHFTINCQNERAAHAPTFKRNLIADGRIERQKRKEGTNQMVIIFRIRQSNGRGKGRC
jgi:hypothetical protein